jgi:hypothetical protein
MTATRSRAEVQGIIDRFDAAMESAQPAELATVRTALIALRDEPTPTEPPLAVVTVVEADMLDPDDEDPDYRVGDILVACPGCSAVNTFYEVDQHIGWNEVEVDGGLISVHQIDTTRETVGYRCQVESCGTEFDLPALGSVPNPEYVPHTQGMPYRGPGDSTAYPTIHDDLFEFTWS